MITLVDKATARLNLLDNKFHFCKDTDISLESLKDNSNAKDKFHTELVKLGRFSLKCPNMFLLCMDMGTKLQVGNTHLLDIYSWFHLYLQRDYQCLIDNNSILLCMTCMLCNLDLQYLDCSV